MAPQPSLACLALFLESLPTSSNQEQTQKKKSPLSNSIMKEKYLVVIREIPSLVHKYKYAKMLPA